jgi:hypothetical protein
MKGKSRDELIVADVRGLHPHGNAQRLFREMGRFSKFAISFSIISILTGAILLYGYGLKFAGPIMNSIGMVGQITITAGIDIAVARSGVDLAPRMFGLDPAIPSACLGGARAHGASTS